MAEQYYGYQCYDNEGNPLGWLYAHSNDTELAFTTRIFDWCKRWKTEQGAKKNFDWYNNRWHFKTKGGYLKIEVMPEIPSDPYQNQQKWQQKNPDTVQESKAKYDAGNPVWSVRLKSEIREWLEEERWADDNGIPETNAALVNRKLEKLMQLERQGF